MIVEMMERVVNAEEAIAALSALAQEHRLAVFRLLVQAGKEGMPAGAIAEALGVPNSSLSFHLAHLHRAGLVSQERRSRSLIYSADYAAMNALVGYLMENCCAGSACPADAAFEPTTILLQEKRISA
jgi:ArsR family transcriptional regulator